ncbi:MAG: hypothetical protein DRG78_05175 [Epsilonproteobacteria bacterium]|nr:MAG: hypothetical protein DRG78_05175 [Campylobacterota bacterium]
MNNTKIDQIMYCAIELINKDINTHKDLISELFKLVLKLNHTIDDGLIIAQYISSNKYLNDKVWAKEVYKQILLDAGYDEIVICKIIQSIASKKYLNDVNWAKSLYEIIVEKNTDEFNLYLTINIIKSRKFLKDKKWIRIILNKIMSKIKDYSNIEIFIFDLVEIDCKFTKVYIKKYIELTDSPEILSKLANTICDIKCFNVSKLLIIIFKKILLDSKAIYLHKYIIQNISSKEYLNNKSWAILLYKQILYKQSCVEDVIEIANSIKNNKNINKKKWAEKIYKNPYKYLLK